MKKSIKLFVAIIAILFLILSGCSKSKTAPKTEFKYMQYESGASYEGEWTNDTANGKGKFTSSNGAVYTGDFLNVKFHGKGKYEFSN
jgi:hypothetical protein